MLISLPIIRDFLRELQITPKKVLHIGAHYCEELANYAELDVQGILWIDALQEKVDLCRKLGITNIYQAVISDRVGEVAFHITNNGQSSSLLELGTHATHYPTIEVTESRTLSTTTLPLFFQNLAIDPAEYNIWNLDIQGAELLVLQGAKDLLRFVDVLYLEVNEEEVYKGCATLEEVDAFLESHSFVRIYTVMMPQKWGDALYVRKDFVFRNQDKLIRELGI